MRRRAKVDENHEAIVQALRAVGWRVCSLASLGAGVPDLLVRAPDGQLRLVEVKGPKGKLTADQVKFIAEGWDVTVVRSVDDALGL